MTLRNIIDAGIMAKPLLSKISTSISLILENFPSHYDGAMCAFAYVRARCNKNCFCFKSREFISNRNYSRIVSLLRSTQLWLLWFVTWILAAVLIKVLRGFNKTSGAPRDSYKFLQSLFSSDLCFLNNNCFAVLHFAGMTKSYWL